MFFAQFNFSKKLILLWPMSTGHKSVKIIIKVYFAKLYFCTLKNWIYFCRFCRNSPLCFEEKLEKSRKTFSPVFILGPVFMLKNESQTTLKIYYFKYKTSRHCIRGVLVYRSLVGWLVSEIFHAASFFQGNSHKVISTGGCHFFSCFRINNKL